MVIKQVENSKRMKQSRIFIKWLLDPQNQKELIEYKISRHINSFGFFSGFSSVRNVNERILTAYYPSLLGKIPQERYFSEIEFISLNWLAVKQQVIIPWLRNFITNKTEISLDEYYKDWLYYTVTE